jgi:Ca2+-binding RTX toxin-like protein
VASLERARGRGLADGSGEEAMKSRVALACVVMLMGVLLVGGVAFAKNFDGTAKADEITGTRKHDEIRGLGGDDRLSGSGGPDLIYGGEDNDRIRGGNGDDRLKANDDNRDRIKCGAGNDIVYADVKDIVFFGCETVRRPM